MPVTYTIDQAAGLVRMECSGVFTNQEMLDSLERLHSDPARRAGMPSLVDCRRVEQLLVTRPGLQAAVTIEASLVDPGQAPWAVAIVAPQDDVFWMARTYEVMRSGSPENVRVFRDALEAEGWLHQRNAE
ncbi:hypothetical protein BH24GEM1_BH24GEM1_24700 [soil metagenome]